jgi:hypothetical protein
MDHIGSLPDVQREPLMTGLNSPMQMLYLVSLKKDKERIGWKRRRSTNQVCAG